MSHALAAPRPATLPLQQAGGSRAVLPMCAFLIVAAWLITVSARRYAIAAPGYDAAYFTQAAWLIGHGQPPIATMRGIHLLGDHAYFGFWPIAYITRLGNPTMILFVVQALAIAAAVFPLAALCRAVAGLGQLGTALILAAYALYPAVHNINSADFHPESVAVPFMLGACHAAATARWKLLALCSAVTVTLREDLAVSIAGLGVLVFLTVARRPGAILTAASAAVYLLETRVVMPHYAGGRYVQQEQLKEYGGSLPGLGRSILTNPLGAVADLLTAEHAALLFALLAPVAFLPLLGARWLLPAVPVQAALLFTDRHYAHTIDAQYVTQAIPFVVVAAAVGLGRLRRTGGRDVVRLAAPIVVVAAVTGCLVLANDIPRHDSSVWHANSPRVEGMRAAVAHIPDGAAVTATAETWTSLAQRRALYDYPAVDSGRFISGSAQVPEVACWAVVAIDEPSYIDSPPGAQWKPVFAQDVYRVLRRC